MSRKEPYETHWMYKGTNNYKAKYQMSLCVASQNGMLYDMTCEGLDYHGGDFNP